MQQLLNFCDPAMAGGGPGGLTPGLYPRRGAIKKILLGKVRPGAVAHGKELKRHAWSGIAAVAGKVG